MLFFSILDVLLNPPTYYRPLLGSLGAFVAILFCILLIKKDKHFLINCNFNWLRVKNIIIIFWITVSFDLLIGYLTYITNFFSKINYSPSIELLFEENQICFYILICLVIPLLEEIFYRGLIFNELKEYLPIWAAIIFQTLIYIISPNMTKAIMTFPFGVLLSIVYLWFKTIWAPILMRIIFNSLALLPFSVLFEKVSDYYQPPFIIIISVMIISSIYLIWKDRDIIFKTSR